MMKMYGLELLENIDHLPQLDPDKTCGQFASNARDGGNNDGFYSRNFLYQYGDNDYVMCDLKGAGVVNRIWFTGSVDTQCSRMKIYFDEELEPRINAPFKEFFSGRFCNLVAPLNSNGEFSAGGEISYFPFVFSKSIKIVFSGKSASHDALMLPGFFYQVDYELFSAGTDVKSYDGTESTEKVQRLWQNCGLDPKPLAGNAMKCGIVDLVPDESQVIFEEAGIRQIRSIKLSIPNIRGNEPNRCGKDILNNVWVRMLWDNETEPCVDAPIGSFFGIGDKGVQNPVKALMFGIDDQDVLYMYFPMPFNSYGKVEIYSKNSIRVSNLKYEIQSKPFVEPFEDIGYFHAKYTYTHVAKDDPFDVTILDVPGSGKFVGLQQNISGPGVEPTYEEGDVRIFIDQSRSPQYLGTGLEDFYNGAGYFLLIEKDQEEAVSGWGIFSNPLAGFTAREDTNMRPSISVYRTLLHDAVSFRNGIKISVEHGGGALSRGYYGPVSADYYNLVFYYHNMTSQSMMTDKLVVSDIESEKTHDYIIKNQLHKQVCEGSYAGDLSDIVETACSIAHKGTSEFTMNIDSKNAGIVIRKKSCGELYQAAEVYIDDEFAGIWGDYSHNAYFTFSECDFTVGQKYTKNKSKIKILIKSILANPWSETEYAVYSINKTVSNMPLINNGHTYNIGYLGDSLSTKNNSQITEGNVYRYKTSITIEQNWRIVKIYQDAYAIVNAASGKTLTALKCSHARSILVCRKWEGEARQMWRFESVEGGFTISSLTGETIDMVSDGLLAVAHTPAKSQIFMLTLRKSPALKGELSDGVYRIISENDDRVIDSGIGSTMVDESVRIHTAVQSSAQYWRISFFSDHSCELISLFNGKALTCDVDSNETKRFFTSSIRDKGHQKFYIKDIGLGQYQIASKIFDEEYVFGIKYAQTNSNAPDYLDLVKNTCTSSQIWRLEKVLTV